ncbi:MAG TPA: 23S rRNA (uracil(1939)-C(5))-methyltransferase RlmD [Lachnoclostridium sp.]|nr:23S rRNA (uracil(1939)-C(5))-methyltransferase RlmD [Lachnoclostridium sp.]
MKQDRNIKKETGKKKPAARKQSWSLDEKFEEWVGEKPARGAGEKKGAKPGKKGRQESVQEFGRENDRKSERKFVQKNTGKFVGKNDKSFGRDADSKQKSGASLKNVKAQAQTPAEQKRVAEKPQPAKKKGLCPVAHRCGGCQYLDMPYKEQLQMKQSQMQKLLGNYCKVHGIKGMDDPFHYRNKVHAVFGYRKGEAISGVYEEKTHNIVPVETCMIEDQKADEIIGTIRGMLKSFKIHTYDEDTGYGLLRHVLIRRGFTSGQIMVVLVTASPVFPSKNNFVKALRQKHPEITTIVQNINNRGTSMVLGDKEHILYGKGFIEDELCGCKFRISPKSFYQVNPVQTEYLYGKAIELAGLTGNERVLDAYCGIGTIGIIAASKAKEVIGVELNADAVRDAIQNAKCNDVKNIRFFCNDATEFMMQMAASGDSVDVVLMDPPRAGSTEAFIKAVSAVKAKTVIYVSCGPDTLARDLGVFKKMGYRAEGAWPVDMFPATGHCEVICLLSKKAQV